MGINVVLNGYVYHFDDEERFIDLIDSNCNDAYGTDRRINEVLYDDEMY